MIREYLGMDKKDVIKRLPSYIRGTILQTIYSHQETREYNLVPGRHDVMLVPGLFCSPSVFNRLGAELEDKFNVHTPRPFPYWFSMLCNTGSVERSALELVKDINDLTTERGVTRLSLVGHSLGGIVILYMLGKYYPSYINCTIHSVVLLGTPINGSPITKLLGFIPACKDLQPTSDMIKNIISYCMIDYVVVSGFDSIVPSNYQIPFSSDDNFFDGTVDFFHDFQHTDFYAGSKEKVRKTANLIISQIEDINNGL